MQFLPEDWMGGLSGMSLTFRKLADSWEWVMPGSGPYLELCLGNKVMKGQQVGFRRYWNRHTLTPLEPHWTVLPLQHGIPTPHYKTIYSPLSALIFVLGTGPWHSFRWWNKWGVSKLQDMRQKGKQAHVVTEWMIYMEAGGDSEQSLNCRVS